MSRTTTTTTTIIPPPPLRRRRRSKRASGSGLSIILPALVVVVYLCFCAHHHGAEARFEEEAHPFPRNAKIFPLRHPVPVHSDPRVASIMAQPVFGAATAHDLYMVMQERQQGHGEELASPLPDHRRLVTNGLFTCLANLILDVVELASSKLQTIVDFFEDPSQQGEDVPGGFAVPQAEASDFESYLAPVETLQDAVQTLFDVLYCFMNCSPGDFLIFIKDVLCELISACNDVLDAVTEVVAEILDFLADAIDAIFGTDLSNGIGNAIAEVLDELFDPINTLVEEITGVDFASEVCKAQKAIAGIVVFEQVEDSVQPSLDATFARCDGNSCANGSTCVTVPARTCLCPDGYYGTFCGNTIPLNNGLPIIQPDVDANGCSTYFCDRGTCAAQNYFCVCPQGWAGLTCEIKNECDPLPCQNGGVCVDKVQDYECHCPDGYSGKKCESGRRLQSTTCPLDSEEMFTPYSLAYPYNTAPYEDGDYAEMVSTIEWLDLELRGLGKTTAPNALADNFLAQVAAEAFSCLTNALMFIGGAAGGKVLIVLSAIHALVLIWEAVMEARMEQHAYHDALIQGENILSIYRNTQKAMDGTCAILDNIGCDLLPPEQLALGPYGCDGIDNDCDNNIDECEEDKVAPTLYLEAVKAACGVTFPSVEKLAECISSAVMAQDDCSASTWTTVAVASDGPLAAHSTCSAGYTATVTARDDCGNEGISTLSFGGWQVDFTAPQVSCHFAASGGNELILGMQGDSLAHSTFSNQQTFSDVELVYAVADVDCDASVMLSIEVFSDEYQMGRLYKKQAVLYDGSSSPGGRLKLLLDNDAANNCNDQDVICYPVDAIAADGRVYTIHFAATDEAGLTGFAECTVRVNEFQGVLARKNDARFLVAQGIDVIKGTEPPGSGLFVLGYSNTGGSYSQ